MRIEEIIEKRNLKQTEAAKILKINQPKISALVNGKLSDFSMERLIHFLNLLNQDVEIVIREKPYKKGKKTSLFGHIRVAYT